MGVVNESNERKALVAASVRLRERFPAVRAETIDALLVRCHQEYDGRPVREFVPLLVERQVREHLEHGSTSAWRQV
jgi:hypothetical protein